MQNTKVRVIVGSDGAQARDVLSGLVEKQSGIVVGQARNAIEAVTLSRNLRPDVVILDSYLPHTFGMKDIAISRAGGLDAAQYIRREVPNARVLLVGNLDTAPSLDMVSLPSATVSLYEDTAAPGMPLFLGNLPAAKTDNPIYVRLLAGRLPARGWYARAAEHVMLFGLGGVLFGLMMMVTGILFLPGIIVTALGAAGLGLGFLGRTIMRRYAGKGINHENSH